MHMNRTFLGIMAILLLITSVSAAPLPQSTDEGIFFPETGHWVKGKFLEYYQQNADPLLLFGYPITDAIAHPYRQGVEIQYFQRARMELDLNAAANQNIQLAPLGELLYDDSASQHGRKADFTVNTGACRLFSSTGKYVCYAFLQFYDGHEGSVNFGDPITDVEVIDGMLVQYFTRSRMEWHPEMPAGKHVTLTDVGRLDFDRTIGDFKIMEPSGFIPQSSLTEIHVRAFPERPLVASGSRQKIYVIVQDQFLQPLSGALVTITVRLPDGRVENYHPQDPTNTDGFTQAEFDVQGLQPNQVVEVAVSASILNGPDGQSQTWFRIWW